MRPPVAQTCPGHAPSNDTIESLTADKVCRTALGHSSSAPQARILPSGAMSARIINGVPEAPVGLSGPRPTARLRLALDVSALLGRAHPVVGGGPQGPGAMAQHARAAARHFMQQGPTARARPVTGRLMCAWLLISTGGGHDVHSHDTAVSRYRGSLDLDPEAIVLRRREC